MADFSDILKIRLSMYLLLSYGNRELKSPYYRAANQT
jgi:hypothetical protein